MNDHPGGLVDDDQVVVLVKHIEPDLLRLRFQRHRRRYLDADNVADADAVAGFVRLAVDGDVRLLDEFLEKRARPFRYLRLQEPVEALAAFVVGDGEHAARITQSGSFGKVDSAPAMRLTTTDTKGGPTEPSPNVLPKAISQELTFPTKKNAKSLLSRRQRKVTYAQLSQRI